MGWKSLLIVSSLSWFNGLKFIPTHLRLSHFPRFALAVAAFVQRFSRNFATEDVENVGLMYDVAARKVVL
jgi:hypothetical protein